MPGIALILFAHGARDPEWADPMWRVRAALREQAPALRVELAFLEMMKPELRECAESLLGEGFEQLVVLPMFIARGGHLKRDVPRLLEDLRVRHPAGAKKTMALKIIRNTATPTMSCTVLYWAGV